MEAIEGVAENHSEWSKNYVYDNAQNEFLCKDFQRTESKIVDNWFAIAWYQGGYGPV